MADKDDEPQDENTSDNYLNEGFEDVEEGNGQSQNLGKGPAVAAPPGKTALMAGVGILLVGFLLYQLFFAESEEELPPPPPETSRQAAPAPVAQADIPIPQIPVEPPAPPTPELPPLPELPPAPALPPPPTPVDVDLSAQGPTSEQQQARLKANIMLQGGAAKPLQDTGDSNFLSGIYARRKVDEEKFKSGAQRSVATHVGDLRKLILQGKIIQAVLETAVDTSLPGSLRAIVSRDVFAESGRDILIPKGSRIIGNYNADVVRGQARLFIIWSRLIRPDGVDIDLSSPATDEMGRAGLVGYIDNRYFEIFSGALLTSAFTIGLAATAQGVTGAEATTSTQNTDGSQTQNGDPTSAAIQQAVTNMGTTAQNVLQGLIDMRPMITLDQGTPFNIFVNKDLEFPDEVTSRIKLMQ